MRVDGEQIAYAGFISFYNSTLGFRRRGITLPFYIYFPDILPLRLISNDTLSHLYDRYACTFLERYEITFIPKSGIDGESGVKEKM